MWEGGEGEGADVGRGAGGGGGVDGKDAVERVSEGWVGGGEVWGVRKGGADGASEAEGGKGVRGRVFSLGSVGGKTGGGGSQEC